LKTEEVKFRKRAIHVAQVNGHVDERRRREEEKKKKRRRRRRIDDKMRTRQEY